MITSELSNKVLIIGTDMYGKGGIALLIKTYSTIFVAFNYVCCHRFTNKALQCIIALKAIFKTIFFCVFKSIDIVHIHTASYNSFFRDSIYLLIAKVFKKKVILHIHGGKFEEFYNQHPAFCIYICKKADCIVAVSQYFGETFKRLQLNPNIRVIYNSASDIIPHTSYKNKGNMNLNITFLGAIVENKGIFDILECFRQNSNYYKEKNICLHICGTGNYNKLKSIIDEYNLNDIIEYHGWVNKEEKSLLLSKTDIYLQPSYFESLGIAIIEAMNFSIPIIATTTGGIPELIEHGKNGLLIPPGAIKDLHTSLYTLIEDSFLRQTMGLNAYYKSKEFTNKKMAYNLNSLYTELINK